MDAPADLGRQLRRLQRSRTRWKERVAAKQGQILYLRVRVRDLEASREHWKQRALVAEAASGPTLTPLQPEPRPGER
jgi:hypothetical protein